ncbi:hypothetical protein [Rhodoferax fermentans]|uniref:Uncharacterized protein n=1 Tax=Rhodoferax fermentans TaxID=28066 RepID=A0A1T1AP77_RHOFE|nr:hypothetical protein [Rhodoferax fermentans]MBK1683115.1 hypothetical protein [Rhodoferax fermentans]OOV05728.1 hypothetical protein RF819_02540 [Rhodoferax fermentans]
MNNKTQRATLAKIIQTYEAAPAKGNTTDEMIARTEYMLAKQMLNAAQTGEKTWDSFSIDGPRVSEDFGK